MLARNFAQTRVVKKLEENYDNVAVIPGPCVYILELENDCWYIGSTKDLDKRLKKHQDGAACAWTRKHPVLSLSDYVPLDSDENSDSDMRAVEDLWTKHVMFTNGIDNVRGGSYTAISLPEYQLRALEQESRHFRGECYKCGSIDHFASHCPETSPPPPRPNSSDTLIEEVRGVKDSLKAVNAKLSGLERFTQSTIIPTLKNGSDSEVVRQGQISSLQKWRRALVPSLRANQESLIESLLSLETNFEGNMNSLGISVADVRNEFVGVKGTLDELVELKMEALRLDDALTIVWDEIGSLKDSVESSIAAAALKARDKHELEKQIEGLKEAIQKIEEKNEWRGRWRRRLGSFLLRPFTRLSKALKRAR